MDPFIPLATPVLPTVILDFNLLRGYMDYVTLAFLISFILRLRFYHAVYRVAKHLSLSCPNVYKLIHEHAFLFFKDGVILPIGVYGAVLGVYLVFTWVLFPMATISLAGLAALHPLVLVLVLLLVGTMMTLDCWVVLHVSKVDAEQVTRDLNLAEGWLGGRLNGLLSLLGKWNPIKLYADSLTRESMKWFNQTFRASLAMMITQLALRLSVVATLMACFLLHR